MKVGNGLDKFVENIMYFCVVYFLIPIMVYIY